MNLHQVKAFGTDNAQSPLKEFIIPRRSTLDDDVAIEILYCGVCHSDLHMVKNEWGGSVYPMVPGHEIVGKVLEVGSNVSKFQVGQLVGVGVMVDSCRSCINCQEGLEQYCLIGFTDTYNANDQHLKLQTYGGYSKSITVNQDFVLTVPDNLDLASVAPLLCAGITTYSPLRYWKAGIGVKVAVVGLGGLGHMAVKLAKAMGAEVTVITSSKHKIDDALALGADHVVLSTLRDQMIEVKMSFDLVLDCISAEHNINHYLSLLKTNGTLVLVGLPENPIPFKAFSLVGQRRSIGGSTIGGIKETQEMLDFCGMHNITADIELIGINDVNSAFEKLLKSDVRYRFVIDMSTL